MSEYEAQVGPELDLCMRCGYIAQAQVRIHQLSFLGVTALNTGAYTCLICDQGLTVEELP